MPDDAILWPGWEGFDDAERARLRRLVHGARDRGDGRRRGIKRSYYEALIDAHRGLEELFARFATEEERGLAARLSERFDADESERRRVLERYVVLYREIETRRQLAEAIAAGDHAGAFAIAAGHSLWSRRMEVVREVLDRYGLGAARLRVEGDRADVTVLAEERTVPHQTQKAVRRAIQRRLGDQERLKVSFSFVQPIYLPREDGSPDPTVSNLHVIRLGNAS